MNVKLKPCPFCGQDALIAHLDNGQYYPRCTGGSGSFCLLTRLPDLENDGFLHEEDAVRVWNMRKKPPFFLTKFAQDGGKSAAKKNKSNRKAVSAKSVGSRRRL